MNEMKNIQDRNQTEMNNNLNNNSYISKKQVDNANNTNLFKNAAETTSKVNNPYAKAIGKTVRNADKVGDGKVLNTVNKITPGGRSLQRMSNFLGNMGLVNRISSALGKKNSINNGSRLNSLNNLKNAKDNSISDTNIKEKSEEETDNKGYTSFATSFKIIKIGLWVCVAVFPIIIFCCCFISASQTYLSAVGLQYADTVSDDEAGEKIKEQTDEDRNQEIKDEQAYDTYISDEKAIILRNSKLNNNIIQVAKKKYDEKLIEQLEDFYPAVKDLSKNYDEYMVYDFFFKMHKLYMNYSNVYNVELDLSLLMSTLYIQSSDMNVIFESNLSAEYRTGKEEDIPVSELDFYVDWSTYKLSKNDSQHDMEVLAQHMVSLRPNEECKSNELAQDGKCYKYDEEKYKEFLKQFIEKKYYLDRDNFVEYEVSDNIEPPIENENPSDNDKPTQDENKTEEDNGKSDNPNYAEGVTFIDGGLSSNVYYYNQNDYQGYYYSKDPYNLAGHKTSYCSLGIGNCYQSIRSSGCGPTSLSIVVSTLLNEAHDPIELTSKVCGIGGCASSGTYRWALIQTAKDYGFDAYETKDVQKVIEALSTGNSIVIGRAGPGDFTSGGHYINITAVNSDEEFYIVDCNKEKHNHWWSASRIIEQVTNYVIISR